MQNQKSKKERKQIMPWSIKKECKLNVQTDSKVKVESKGENCKKADISTENLQIEERREEFIDQPEISFVYIIFCCFSS